MMTHGVIYMLYAFTQLMHNGIHNVSIVLYSKTRFGAIACACFSAFQMQYLVEGYNDNAGTGIAFKKILFCRTEFCIVCTVRQSSDSLATRAFSQSHRLLLSAA